MFNILWRFIMPPLDTHYMELLTRSLEDKYVSHLPPLIDTSRPYAEQQKKNLSRAFSAFALKHICEISEVEASKAVVDDFDDYGIDAIYYHLKTDTLYLVQSKLKASEQFSQDEALTFCQGVRKLIKLDFEGFNKNIQDRQTEIEDSIENCSNIYLVITHTGSGISSHAEKAIGDLLSDEGHGEERFVKPPLSYDSIRVIKDLQLERAYKQIDEDIWVQKSISVSEPRVTYFGLVKLTELVRLHKKYNNALYEKNIRTFLGQKTEVNVSIRNTLSTSPKDFLYLNNGVAALCREIEKKGTRKSNKDSNKFKVKGFSIINGAQTIASAYHFLEDNPGADLSSARVSITLIKASVEGDFGKSVTRARNHQNPVLLSNFIALDDEQERLRRELAHLGIHYAYKAELLDNKAAPQRIGIEEAVQSLALFHSDPRFVVWLKKEPSRLFDMNSDQYKELFSTSLTAFQLANSVTYFRYIQKRMAVEAIVAKGQERLTYKHGNYVLGWILAKRIINERNNAKLIDKAKLESGLSTSFDQLRQTIWTETNKRVIIKGPLALFRNQTDVIPLIEDVMINHYGLGNDHILEHKRRQQKASQPYPQDLFNYVISNAPQIGNLS